MPVKKDNDGFRYVEAEVEVPGSPEEVWHAIATGKGISSWFVPTSSDEREGGRTVSSFGPDMDAVATITSWNPPWNYVAESVETDSEGTAVESGDRAAAESTAGTAPGDMEAAEEGSGKVATEWIVEARSGGTCIVRVVHRWFSETDDWDAEFEGHAYGWASSFFRMLKLYLTHFAGQDCLAFDLAAFSPSPSAETWRVVKTAFKIDTATQHVESAGDAPSLSGSMESTEITDPELLAVRERSPIIKAALEGMNGDDPELLLRLDSPAPGIAHFFIMPMGDQTMVSVRFFLYGDAGAKAAPVAEQDWKAWLDAQFPPQDI